MWNGPGLLETPSGSARSQSLETAGAGSGTGRALICRLAISFFAGAHRGRYIVSLLRKDVAAAIHPLARLITRLPSPVGDEFTAFIGCIDDVLPRLSTRFRRIKHANDCTQTQPGQEPGKSVAALVITPSHRNPPA